MLIYRMLYSDTCRNQIKKLHPTLKPVIRSKLDQLKKEPFLGKQLERELSGYRSLRARRFRIIYKVNAADQVLELHYIGHRKDIYELFGEKVGNLIVNGA